VPFLWLVNRPYRHTEGHGEQSSVFTLRNERTIATMAPHVAKLVARGTEPVPVAPQTLKQLADRDNWLFYRRAHL